MALNLKKRDLSKYDLEVFVDISGSMQANDTVSRRSRLDDCREKVSLLVQECEKIDTDGVTFGFFNGSVTTYENTVYAKVGPLFDRCRPDGGTATALVLEERIGDYFDQRFGKSKSGLFGKSVPANPNTKPRIIVIFTDGEPNVPSARAARQAVVNVIVNATKRLTAEGLGREALGISFIQTGRDPEAKRFLVELDDDLNQYGATLDIVNCLTVDHCDGLSTKQILELALDD
jgi:hypothetical protein